MTVASSLLDAGIDDVDIYEPETAVKEGYPYEQDS